MSGPRSGRTTQMIRDAVAYVKQQLDVVTVLAGVEEPRRPITVQIVGLNRNHLGALMSMTLDLTMPQWDLRERRETTLVWAVCGVRVVFDFVTMASAERGVGRRPDREFVDHAALGWL